MGIVDLFARKVTGSGKSPKLRSTRFGRKDIENDGGYQSFDEFLDEEFLTREELMELPAKVLRSRCHRVGLDCSKLVEKRDLVQKLHDYYKQVLNQSSPSEYNDHLPQEQEANGLPQNQQMNLWQNSQQHLNNTSFDETDQMHELLEQVLPYFGQGDSAIDATVKDTINRLPFHCLEHRNGEGNTILMMCCQFSAIELLPILLSKGSNPNALNHYGESCLHFTCYSDSFSLEAAEMLVNSGATVEVIENRFGCSPLHYAASMGETEMCKILLSGGANPNTVDSSRCNCIEYAIQSKNQNCINLLMTASVSRPSCHVPSVITDDLNEWEQRVDQNGCIYFCHRLSGESMWAEDFIRRREILSLSIPNIPEVKDMRRLSGQGIPPSTQELRQKPPHHISLHQTGAKDFKNRENEIDTNNDCLLERISELSGDSNSEDSLRESARNQDKSSSKHLVSQDSFNMRLEKMQNDLEKQWTARLEALESRNLKDESEEKISKIRDLTNDLNQRDAEIKSLQDELLRLNNISNRSYSLVDIGVGDGVVLDQNELDILKEQIHTKESLLDEIQRDNNEIKIDLVAKNREIETWIEKYERSVSQIDQIEKLLVQERDAKNQIVSLLEQTREGIDNDAEITKSLEEEKQRDKNTIHRLEQSLDEMEKQRAKEVDKMHQEISDLEKDVLSKTNEISSLKDKLNDEKMSKDCYINEIEERHQCEINMLKCNLINEHHSEVQELKDRLQNEVVSREKAEKAKDDAITESREAMVKKLEAENHCERMANMIKEAKTLITANEKLHRSLQEEIDKRKVLHNMIEDMKGRIRVYVRIRPLSLSEIEKSCVQTLIKEDKRTCVMTDDGMTSTVKSKSWEFDHVFLNSTQDEVFEDTKALITSAIDGFNVCIFAYGQTGSGKTFTMFGPSGNFTNLDDKTAGLAPRVALELFRLLECRESGFHASVIANMYELYNDNLRDLIGSANEDTGKPLKIKLAEHSKSGLVEVEGAVHEEVSNAAQLMDLLQRGADSRSTSSTNMNADSSRSHLITSLVIKLESKRTGNTTNGKLTLVDLAGSERISKSGATGIQLKEAQSINKSLSALGDVINALTTNSRHVPYRNHPLTMLMSDSMGGNAKTLMFVCCSPADYNKSESSNSLDFAQRCKCVTNKIQGGGIDSTQVEALKTELTRLKKQHGQALKRRLSTEPRRGPGQKH